MVDDSGPESDTPLCTQADQEQAAEAAGAAAVLHDIFSTFSSPQWWDPGAPSIPVLFTDHPTAQGAVAAGAATLEALPPTWGFLRVYDAAAGEQVAKFDALPNVHMLPAPDGKWSIHNTEVVGDRAYSSWYSHGVVALDLGPLNRPVPGDPALAGQFVPVPGPSRTPKLPSHVPAVWGLAVRPSDGVIFVSDMNSGLWIIRPTGPAVPTIP